MDIKDLYIMELPHRIVLGRGVIDRIEEEVERLGFRRPVYIVGRYTARYSPGESVIVESSMKEHLDTIDLPDSDVIVGIGGGKNLDAAKYLSLKTGKPYILVPTLPSSDGIASPSISLYTEDGRLSLIHSPPILILIDFDVVARSPRDYILSGYGDVVSKYSSVYDWWLGHRRTGEYFGHLTSRLMVFAFNHVVKDRRRLLTPHGVHVLLESLILSGGGIGIQRSSRPASGSEHLISHAIDIIRIRNGERPGLHGLQVGVSTVFTAYLQRRRWGYVRRVLSEAGHPTTLEEIHVDPDLFADAVLLAPSLRNRYTILNEVELTRKKVLTILEEVEMV